MASNSTNQQMGMGLVGPNCLIRKEELLRSIIQFLHSLGLNSSASQLEQESNVPHRHPQLVFLESLILEGKWQECIQFLIEEIKDRVKSERKRGWILNDVLEQCILEFMSCGDVASALRFLQNDYSGFGVRKDCIHHLGMVMIYKNEMRDVTEMRRSVVAQLAYSLDSQFMMDDTRLTELIEWWITSQINSCHYHNTHDVISLYESDHACGEDGIPTKTVQVLEGHKNEVWFVQFSHSGDYLASSSTDCTAILWKVPEQGNLTVKHILRGHQNPVSFLSWSPNDAMLLTCGQETIKIWNVERGVCIYTFNGEDVPILSSCAWFDDSTKLVFGTCGPQKYIYRFKILQNKLSRWNRSTKNMITALAITPDGHSFICAYAKGYIGIWDRRGRYKSNIVISLPITSICVSRDSKHLLVNVCGHVIHLYDISITVKGPIILTHHTQLKFVIHSCFGGSHSTFTASGSEDSQVYIWRNQWHNLYLEPIKILSGHSMVVNCVSWNPARPQMLASASDDRTIRIWAGC